MTQQKNQIKCDICKKIFTTMSNLKNHKRTVHENERSFNCNLCDKIFKEKGTLKRHQNTHITGEEKLTFKCKILDEGFTRNFNLNQHIRSIHEKIKPFVCQHCEKAYTQNIDLKRHQIKHHDSSENEKEKYLFTCESCGKNLTRKTRLNAHKNKCNKDIALKSTQTKDEKTQNHINQSTESRPEQSDNDQSIEMRDETNIIANVDRDLEKEQNTDMNNFVEGNNLMDFDTPDHGNAENINDEMGVTIIEKENANQKENGDSKSLHKNLLYEEERNQSKHQNIDLKRHQSMHQDKTENEKETKNHNENAEQNLNDSQSYANDPVEISEVNVDINELDNSDLDEEMENPQDLNEQHESQSYTNDPLQISDMKETKEMDTQTDLDVHQIGVEKDPQDLNEFRKEHKNMNCKSAPLYDVVKNGPETPNVSCKSGSKYCKICKITYKDPKNLLEHSRICHWDQSSKSTRKKPSTERFSCNICKESFPEAIFLAVHCEMKHQVKSEFACAICKKKFPKIVKLTKHYLVDHSKINNRK